jgi:RHS repeat-associated protein
MTYFHVDHQGTPIARSDAWGTVFERTRRQSFGQPLVGPLKNGPGYTGHMEDPGTGLVYMQQRYYDPAIARFLSVDPVGPLEDAKGHFGRYHYALNNPYKYTDPDGRCAVGTRIPTAECEGFNGVSVGNVPERPAADFRSDSSEVGELQALRARQFVPVRQAAQRASAIGDGLETIYFTAISGGVGGGVAAGALKGADRVASVLNGLRVGRHADVKLVSSVDELNALFRELTSGGKAVQGGTYPGRLVKLPDGTTVGLRSQSKSGGPTVDIKLPDGSVRKIHISQ